MNTVFEKKGRGGVELCVCGVCSLDLFYFKTEAHLSTDAHYYSTPHCQGNKNLTVTLVSHTSSHHELRIRTKTKVYVCLSFCMCVCCQVSQCVSTSFFDPNKR